MADEFTYIKLGGRLLSEDIPDVELRAIALSMQEYFQKGDRFGVVGDFSLKYGRVEFALTRSVEFNAIAAKMADREYIGVTYGVLPTMKFLCQIFMADPKNFPNIGRTDNLSHFDSNRWIDLRGGLAKIVLSQDDMREAIADLPKLCAPRVYLAAQIALCGFFFLVHHELGHIICCHLAFLKKHGEDSLLIEINDSEKILANRQMRRALEIEADQIGFSGSALFLRTIAKSGMKFGISERDMMSAWTPALSLVFQVLNIFSSKKKRTEEESTHPSASARTLGLEWWFQHCPEEIGITRDDFSAGAGYVNSWLKRVGSQPALPETLGSDPVKELARCLFELNRCSGDRRKLQEERNLAVS